MERHPADLVWLALLAVGLGADLPLLARGHSTLSSRAGCTVARKAAVCFLAAHFLGVIPPRMDPLHLAADRLRRNHHEP